MELTFKQSAFRHGVSEVEIRHAFNNPRYDGPIEDSIGCMEGENRYIRLGFNGHGNLLEIFYNEYDDTHVCIFHAMPCRSLFFSLLKN